MCAAIAQSVARPTLNLRYSVVVSSTPAGGANLVHMWVSLDGMRYGVSIFISLTLL